MMHEDKGWMPLEVDFTTTEEELKYGIDGMPASWTLFLLGNGSPTHHLALLTGYPTEVDVIGFNCIGASGDRAPVEIADIDGPRHRRQVFLRNSNGERLGYAASWWNSSDIDALFGKDKTLPIGRQISTQKKELFRDIKHIFRGHSAALEKEFKMPGPFWGRSYLFWQGGRPITLIYEVFSPALQKYMGEINVPAHVQRTS
ncbi:hypothetical protein THRCLA_11515 [Thraustotheca clavata]|uniref:DUF98 domain-containing protein n=1 Tax=Thraustotheca clavata TaxID=74557 RepID=A0A1V9Y7K5_9STRA|nr:hypothetical protein THRCLA_11515 [Thraustotheca clavata]